MIATVLENHRARSQVSEDPGGAGKGAGGEPLVSAAGEGPRGREGRVSGSQSGEHRLALARHLPGSATPLAFSRDAASLPR